MFTAILFIGLCLFTLGAYLFHRSFVFARRGLIAEATVVAVEEIDDGEGTPAFKPVFSYTTHNDEQVAFAGISKGPRQSWFVGDDAIIIYDPQNPSRAKEYSCFGIFGLGIVLMTIGMPVIVFGCSHFIIEMLER